MNKNQFYRYLDEKSILIINKNGKLVRLTCPFVVINKENKKFLVDKVLMNEAGLLYVIKEKEMIYSEYQIE